jgi:putative restriction endonuclease
VARKLGNFGAFDPELKKRDISGLSHTSKLDRTIWHEFNSDWGKLVIEADHIRRQVTGQSLATELDSLIPEICGPTERVTTAKQRIYQNFFRASVLSGFNRRCCICSLPHPEILVASHIIPWSVREDTRVNPQNGLCLCASHDLAFERELLAIATDYSIILCERVKKSKDTASQFLFGAFEGKRILLPDRFAPCEEFLNWRLEVFLKSEAALRRAI